MRDFETFLDAYHFSHPLRRLFGTMAATAHAALWAAGYRLVLIDAKTFQEKNKSSGRLYGGPLFIGLGIVEIAGNELIGTLCARLISLPENMSLLTAMADPFFADCEAENLGEALEHRPFSAVPAIATTIMGRVSFLGGMWVHPDHRRRTTGGSLLPYMMRCLMAAVLDSHKPHNLIGLLQDHHVHGENNLLTRYGFRFVSEDGPYWRWPADALTKLNLAWMGAPEALQYCQSQNWPKLREDEEAA